MSVLAVVLVPVGSIPAHVCDCGSMALDRTPAAVTADPEPCNAAPSCACCATQRKESPRSCCQAKPRAGESGGCQCGSLCQCRSNEAPKSPAVPAGGSPSVIKVSWCLSERTCNDSGLGLKCAGSLETCGHSWFAGLGSVNERLSVLCRFLV